MRVLLLCVILFIGCQPGTPISQPTSLQTDIVIYGATPGGIAAALSSARAGAEVVLIEPTTHIGGMLTNGLSHTDFHSFEALTGIFLEFSQRVKQYYVDTYGSNSQQVATSFEGTFGESKVNLMILENMLAEEANISIMLQSTLIDVSQSDSMLEAIEIETPDGIRNISASIFIDGSYEGDLMAMAGVSYSIGRESRETYQESLAPETGDDQLQGYNFRFCATTVKENQAPVKAPEGYLREDFLDVLPILESGEIEQVFGYPSKCLFKAQLPPLPNGKYDINDVSNGLVRLSMPGYNRTWPEGNAEERKRIFDEHLRYNVGLLYFLQNDEAVPQTFQSQAREWGWCKDEFEDNDHLPRQLYIREARRMKGRYIYTQKDGAHAPGDARAVLHTDAIAMADYGNNCHGTSHEGPLIGGTHRGEFYNVIPPYQIPYGVLLPNEYNNLLVPVAVSSSHVGFCALRLEPVWMALGQASGQAAYLAHTSNLPLQHISISLLQKNLHETQSATIYVSDVLPGHPNFVATQWWGTQGGFHGLFPYREGEQRGENIHGQYYQAAPWHTADLDLTLDPTLKQRWLGLSDSLGISSSELDQAVTRGDFIQLAYSNAVEGGFFD